MLASTTPTLHEFFRLFLDIERVHRAETTAIGIHVDRVVVIAIIAILIALLLSAVQHARAGALETAPISNRLLFVISLTSPLLEHLRPVALADRIGG